jgi:antibiotic biosynthesis monooxygenase (ABM) superfamily enzyme
MKDQNPKSPSAFTARTLIITAAVFLIGMVFDLLAYPSIGHAQSIAWVLLSASGVLTLLSLQWERQR